MIKLYILSNLILHWGLLESIRGWCLIPEAPYPPPPKKNNTDTTPMAIHLKAAKITQLFPCFSSAIGTQ